MRKKSAITQGFNLPSFRLKDGDFTERRGKTFNSGVTGI